MAMATIETGVPEAVAIDDARLGRRRGRMLQRTVAAAAAAADGGDGGEERHT